MKLKIQKLRIICCNTNLLLRKNSILFGLRLFHLIGIQLVFSIIKINYKCSSVNAVNRILCISLFKKSFSHTDKYCQILILICKHMILTEHIHCLKGIYRILLHSSDILPFNMSLHCRLITPN